MRKRDAAVSPERWRVLDSQVEKARLGSARMLAGLAGLLGLVYFSIVCVCACARTRGFQLRGKCVRCSRVSSM